MSWLLIEALVALVLLVAIVWWTLGPVRRGEKRPRKGDDAER
jgi:hypothetical protein